MFSGAAGPGEVDDAANGQRSDEADNPNADPNAYSATGLIFFLVLLITDVFRSW